MPIIESPGYFIIEPTWTVQTTIMWHREEHSQQLQSFLWKNNIEQAINLDLSDAISKSLLTDYTDDEGTLTANIKLVLNHMEETDEKIFPKDINNIMKTFNADFETALPPCPRTLTDNRAARNSSEIPRNQF